MADPEEVFWNPLVPELTVADLEVSLRFYLAVGFRVRYRREHPSFAYLELGGAQIMLQEESGGGWYVLPLDRPLGRGINFQIEVEDLSAVERELHHLGVSLFRPPGESWYATSAAEEEGQRELLVQDPDGYLLRFAQYLGSRRRG